MLPGKLAAPHVEAGLVCQVRHRALTFVLMIPDSLTALLGALT